MDRLVALHPFFIAAGTICGSVGLGLGSAHAWHAPLVSIGGALGTLGGVLARMWQAPAKSEPEAKS